VLCAVDSHGTLLLLSWASFCSCRPCFQVFPKSFFSPISFSISQHSRLFRRTRPFAPPVPHVLKHHDIDGVLEVYEVASRSGFLGSTALLPIKGVFSSHAFVPGPPVRRVDTARSGSCRGAQVISLPRNLFPRLVVFRCLLSSTGCPNRKRPGSLFARSEILLTFCFWNAFVIAMPAFL